MENTGTLAPADPTAARGANELRAGRFAHGHAGERRVPQPRVFAGVAGFLFALCSAATAQCQLEWRAAGGIAGANGTVYASVAWDPDGGGPLGEVVVFGGSFTAAGEASAAGVAVYDPLTEQVTPLGDGFDGDVRALLVDGDGDLVAAGEFTASGGVATPRIARWNGSAWESVGSGFDDGVVRALDIDANGDLLAGGSFDTSNSVQVGHVARWDGASWGSLGFGDDGEVVDVSAAANGDVFAVGTFVTAGAVAATHKARWSSGTWSEVGTASSGSVTCVQVLPGGDVVFGGFFNQIGGIAALKCARWDGVAWTAMDAGIAGYYPVSFDLTPLGDLRVCCVGVSPFLAGYLLGWNGAAWTLDVRSEVGGALHTVTPFGSGGLFAGGEFSSVVGPSAESLATHDVIVIESGSLSSLGQGGFAGAVGRFATDPLGRVWADGSGEIKRWDVDRWVTTGLEGGSGGLAFVDSGLLVIADQVDCPFGLSGPVRFDPLDFYCTGGVGFAALRRRTGEVVVGTSGPRRLLTFDATSTPASVEATTFTPRVLAEQADGRLIAADYDTVHVETATGWSLVGQSNQTFRAVAGLANGDVVVGGPFTSISGNSISYLARWDGSSWYPLGAGPDGPVNALTTLANGDLIVGGEFTSVGGQSAEYIARWDGASWSSLDGDLGGPVIGLHQDADGAVWVGLLTNGDAPTTARLVPTCPAQVVALGQGCSGAGGPNVLDAPQFSLPWLGATFCSQATGLPAVAICMEVIGFGSISLPLAAVLPQAGAGCLLIPTLDVLDAHLPIAGSLELQRALPDMPSIIGAVFHQQVVSLEIGGGGAIVDVTSTNALTYTVGSLE